MQKNIFGKNHLRDNSRRQKIPFERMLKAEEMGSRKKSAEYSQKVSELRQFTWMLKRAGFKDASGTGAGVDIAITTKLRGKEVKITADQRVASGRRHGDNAIETRVKDGKLYNKADWIIVLNRQKQLEAFPAVMLDGFIRQQRGSLRFYERRKKYDVYSVGLSDLYRYMKIHHDAEPIRMGLSKESGKLLIDEMIKLERKKLPPIKEQKGIPKFTTKKKLRAEYIKKAPTKLTNPALQRIGFNRKVNPGINQK
jgi:hypothetical protein